MTRAPARSRWAGWPLLVVMAGLFAAGIVRVWGHGMDSITAALGAAFLILTGVLIATEVHETYHQLDGDQQEEED
jgi:uncharacterized membrane protein YjjP (DUF1212 family)